MASPSTDGAESASCMSSCLPCFSRPKKKYREISTPPAHKPPFRRVSVYESAVEANELTENELAALKELEDAVDGSNDRDSMYFFDAEESIDGVSAQPVASVSYPPAACPDPHPRASVVMDNPSTLMVSTNKAKPQREITKRRSSIARLLRAPAGATAPTSVELQGYPGELNEKEVEAALKFRAVLKQKITEGNDNSYKDMVHAFKKAEEEPYALCRFLRSRSFNVEEVMKMMDEGIETWKDGESHDFYPDVEEAVGAPMPVFLTQYPFLYHGSAKNGCPVCYFKIGKVSVEGIEAMTEIDNIANMCWNIMIFQFPQQVMKAQKLNPDRVVRCEGVTVFDLEGLSSSNMNSRTLDVLKKVIAINVCFPEVLNALVILNAPGFFSWAYKIVRKLLDERTASKISVFSNKAKGDKWMKDHIDTSETLSDYGGTAYSFAEAAKRQGSGSEYRRELAELLSVAKRGKKKYTFELKGDEKATIKIYTRAAAGADVTVSKGAETVKSMSIGEQGAPKPFCTDIASDVAGAGKFDVTVKSKDASNTANFLVVVRVR